MAFRLSTGLRNAMLGSIGFKAAFAGGKIEVYSGAIPDNADSDEGSGTKLLLISVDAGAWPANGINFDDPADGSIAGEPTETWQGIGLANGTAAWFRLYDVNGTTGASTTAVRLDGTIGTSSADMIMTSTSVALSATTTINSSLFTLPATIS